ncbi:MAG: tsaB [Gammaproteobacteria bacterium]|jgi:tRNA threonylcarbamoyladenosine biosynthesis protein TsaB|nr:tsaB [Gammaproteobacteria bacterium]
MILLSLDTSTETCSAALWHNDQIDVISELAPKRHTHLILPMIQTLLEKHQLNIADCDAIAFGEGPGSFTGLRIAAGVAQGLAFAHTLPLIPVSTLAALALAAKIQQPQLDYFVPALDARMQEVYFAIYTFEKNRPLAIVPDSLAAPAKARVSIAENTPAAWLGIGQAYAVYPDLSQGLEPAALMLDAYPNAKEIALLAKEAFMEGHVVNSTEALPKYLRNDVAKKIV